jgi:hypothetical protein
MPLHHPHLNKYVVVRFHLLDQNSLTQLLKYGRTKGCAKCTPRHAVVTTLKQSVSMPSTMQSVMRFSQVANTLGMLGYLSSRKKYSVPQARRDSMSPTFLAVEALTSGVIFTFRLWTAARR